jgi:hypothetical protein
MPQRDTLAMTRFTLLLHNVLHLAGMLLTLLVDMDGYLRARLMWANDSQLEFSACMQRSSDGRLR